MNRYSGNRLTGKPRILMIVVWLLCAGDLAAQDRPPDAVRNPPRSPQESLECIRVRAGFRVELVAAEPLVQDPIALAWGADARLWVVEMRDYPNGENGAGRIRVLEDVDGDGKMDTSTIFLDGLQFPTGVLPWRKGVLITCAPHILFAEDTDGDGRSDRSEVLFSGFTEGNPQHRVNGLRWGLDNWIYGANGDSGGQVVSNRTGQTTDIHAHDFRIQPDRGRLEVVTGMSQFGRCRDDWGNWFGTNSDWPFWHNVIEQRYLVRNPALRPIDPWNHVIDPPAGVPVYPLVPTDRQAGTPVMTSACGATVYRDDLFGPVFTTSYFVCEPRYHLIHHQIMKPRGATFASERPADAQTDEFLASTDEWFSPTSVRTGPDGALWITDMYRLVIEHPEWIRAEWQGKLDLRAGERFGRIYRVRPIARSPRPFKRLDQLDNAALVAMLDCPNGTQRDLAQQLIVERRDAGCRAPLEELVRQCRRPAGRLAALAALDGIGLIQTETLVRALGDPHPAVRRHAIRLSEPLLDGAAPLREAVCRCADDADSQVQLQVALVLGAAGDAQAARALTKIAIQHSDDPYIRMAVMSSAGRHSSTVLVGLLTHQAKRPAHLQSVNDLLRFAIDGDQDDLLALGLSRISEHPDHATWQFEVLGNVLDDLSQRGMPLDRMRGIAVPELRAAIDDLDGLFDAARRIVSDPTQPLELRIRALPLLGRGLRMQDSDVDRLTRLLVPQSPPELQRAAVTLLGKIDRPEIPERLLRNWSGHAPSLRQRIVEVLLERSEWTRALLTNLESGRVALSSLSVEHRAKLMLHYLDDVRHRFARIVKTPVESNRQRVVERYRDEIDDRGDEIRGKRLFNEHCITCHRFTDGGQSVGPDLRSLTDRSIETLLVALLAPSRHIEPKYQVYVAMTLDGRVMSGVLASESRFHVTLVEPGGRRQTLLRSELEIFKSTEQSLMPDGLELLLPGDSDLNDLIAYLRAH